MPADTLPTYAIVELLIRMGEFDPNIGDYVNHTVYQDQVMVKTTHVNIMMPVTLIMRQFNSPEAINKQELKEVALKAVSTT